MIQGVRGPIAAPVTPAAPKPPPPPKPVKVKHPKRGKALPPKRGKTLPATVSPPAALPPPAASLQAAPQPEAPEDWPDAPPVPQAPPRAKPPAARPEPLIPANDDDGEGRPGIAKSIQLDRIGFLEEQLSDLLSDVRESRQTGQLRLVSQLDKRVSDVRAELDRERERERKIVKLTRTPAAICAELARRADAIAIRAEMFRRKLAPPSEGEE